MGCSLGALKSKHKSASNSSPIVNGRLSSLGSGPRCSRNAVQEAYLEHRLEMDDRCPLSDRQLYTLMKSWKAISRNMSQTAINMFVRYVVIRNTNAHEFVRLYKKWWFISCSQVRGVARVGDDLIVACLRAWGNFDLKKEKNVEACFMRELYLKMVKMVELKKNCLPCDGVQQWSTLISLQINK